jgi:hypothetical protein
LYSVPIQPDGKALVVGPADSPGGGPGCGVAVHPAEVPAGHQLAIVEKWVMGRMHTEAIEHTFGIHQRTITMHEDEEGVQVEKANVELRQAMIRYNSITDHTDRYELASTLVQKKLMVPVHLSEDPDKRPVIASMVKGANGVIFDVYTSSLQIPENCKAEDIAFVPFVDLLQDICADNEMAFLRIDPDADHGVGFMFTDGTPQMFPMKRVKAYMDESDMGNLDIYAVK